jgi:hypothetical protein
MELIAAIFPFAIYDNQALIPVHKDNDALSVLAGGTLSNNTYQWYRVTRAGNTIITTIAGDSVFHPSEGGKYFAEVFNSVATKLTLTSDTARYAARGILNTAPVASSENEIQQDKINLFLIYPNPARNILYVQTSGEESFSLLSQSGQILLTANIKGSGSFDVSGMAAGLYYLRNNGNGVVKKVIISR